MNSCPPSAAAGATHPAPRDKAIAIVGTSNSGKTELICGLLAWFAAQGLRAAVLKHSHKHNLGDDGKDTWRYRQAGGRLVALAAPGLLQITRSVPDEPRLAEVLAELAPEADLILVEGYKTSDLSKIGVVAPEAGPTPPDYPGVVAWVGAAPLATALPVFQPGQIPEIGRFIRDRLKCP